MNTLTWRLLTAEELTRVYLNDAPGFSPDGAQTPEHGFEQ